MLVKWYGYSTEMCSFHNRVYLTTPNISTQTTILENRKMGTQLSQQISIFFTHEISTTQYSF